MAKLAIKGDGTSVLLLLFIQDSTSTTGAGKTGLAHNTSGLTCYYVRPGSTATSVSLVTQTVTGAYVSGGFVEIDATNMPGFYRFDIPNAALAAGVRSVGVLFKGATGMAPLPLEIDLGAEVVDPAGVTTLLNRIGTPSNLGSGATVAANLADIEGQTDDIGVAGAGLTALGDTRLTYLDTTVSSRLATSGYTAPPSAATVASQVRTELNPELGRIDTAVSTRMAASYGEEQIEGNYSRDGLLRIIAAALAGETSGSGSPTVEFLGLDGATTRISATLDGSGNRTALTLDGDP